MGGRSDSRLGWVLCVALTLACGGTSQTSSTRDGATGGTGGSSACTSDAGSADAAALQAPIAGLTVWLDASRGVTTSGCLVEKWVDQTGGGTDLIPGAVAPTLLRGALRGNDALHFTMSPDPTLSAGLSLSPEVAGTKWASSPFLLELVVRHTTPPGHFSALFWAQQDVQFNDDLEIYGNTTTQKSDLAILADGAGIIYRVATPTGGYNDGTLHVIGAMRDDNYNLTLMVDGQVVQTTTGAGVSIGDGFTSVSIGEFEGDLFEVIGKAGAVSTDDLAALNSYFQARYGTP